MHRGHVTTPFGRRPMTLALVKRQVATAEAAKDRPVDKWKVFRDVCEARAILGVQDRALAVLDALLTFYPAQELSVERPMVVFPSNAQLSVRAHGIAGTTLRRHLAALVEAGLIIRRDSPNGKRYARKDGAGAIESAYGFDLSPLLARAGELAMLAQQVVAYVQKLRTVDLFKNPGIAETIDWATALTELDKVALDPETIADTIGALLKYQDDIARIQGSEGRKTLDEVRAELRATG